MSSLDQSQPTPRAALAAVRTAVQTADVLPVAAAAGALLGVLDTLFQHLLPYPQDGLLDSGVLWAVAAVGIGAWVGPHRRGAGRAAMVFLLAALASYDVLRVLTAVGGNALGARAILWLVVAFVVGPWLGELGALARSGRLRSGQAIGLGAALLAYLLLPSAVETALGVLHTGLSVGLVR